MDEINSIGQILYLHRNTLERSDTYDQLITEPITESYFSYEGEEMDSIVPGKSATKRTYCKYRIMLSEKLTENSRAIYSLM